MLFLLHFKIFLNSEMGITSKHDHNEVSLMWVSFGRGSELACLCCNLKFERLGGLSVIVLW